MRQIKYLALSLSLLLLIFPSLAKNNSIWSVYLYDNINNELIQVNSDSETVQSYSLGIAPDTYIFGLSISDDGSKVALCHVRYDETDSSISYYTFVLRDIVAESNIMELELGDIAGCTVSAYTNDAIALSIVYQEGGFHNPPPPDGLSWELRLLEPNTGEEVASLDSDNPNMPPVPFYDIEDVPVLARVIEINPESVKFIAIGYVGTEGPTERSAFEWHIADGTISELPSSVGRVNSDYLPLTDEVVFPALDETLPYVTPMGMIEAANLVNVQDANGVRTIYHNPELSVATTTFVNNGQSVLVSLLYGFDESNPNEENFASQYVLLNRDGSVLEFEGEFNGAVYIESIPDGAIFIYTPNSTTESPEWKPTEVYILNPDGSLSLHTSFMPNYDNGWSPPQLIWTSPAETSSDLSPFVGQ